MSNTSSEDFEKVDSSSHSPTEDSTDKDQWQSETENKTNVCNRLYQTRICDLT